MFLYQFLKKYNNLKIKLHITRKQFYIEKEITIMKRLCLKFPFFIWHRAFYSQFLLGKERLFQSFPWSVLYWNNIDGFCVLEDKGATQLHLRFSAFAVEGKASGAVWVFNVNLAQVHCITLL